MQDDLPTSERYETSKLCFGFSERSGEFGLLVLIDFRNVESGTPCRTFIGPAMNFDLVLPFEVAANVPIMA